MFRTLEELAKEQKRKASSRKKELEAAGVDLAAEGVNTIDKQEDSAAKLLQFLEKARNGEMIPPDVIIRYANYFHDDLTLDNMPRMQLINMCKYMSIAPYGSDSFLRFQLRHRIRVLKEDDQRILWEGIDSLTKMELREACQERGMRSTGLSKDAYKRALQQWLDLSVNMNVPISLLIMSRTFFLREEMFERKADDGSKSLAGLVDAISGLDKEVLNEVILEVATSQEKTSNPDIKKIKLEVLTLQNELIRQEEEAREAAAKKRDSGEKRPEGATVKQPVESADSPITIDANFTATEDSAKTTVSDNTTATQSSTVADEPIVEEEDRGLSTREMDAISQLLAHDPVVKERAELEKIKAAMKGEDVKDSERVDTIVEAAEPNFDSTIIDGTTKPVSFITDSTADKIKKEETMSSTQTQSASSVEGSTTTSPASYAASASSTSDANSIVESDDPVVARLKRRLESMVDKIEVQMSAVQVRIGDRLHFLDKDRDGILSRDEVALCLQQVLKRKISLEEALEIADEMVRTKVMHC
jgi:LETM1-like protein